MARAAENSETGASSFGPSRPARNERRRLILCSEGKCTNCKRDYAL